MADIIPLDEKLKISKAQENELARKRKILAVQKIFHCTQCASKCAKCGTQIGVDQGENRKKAENIRAPYQFCESCSEEYIEFIERLKGRGDPDCYWHNDLWLDLWQKWIDYQSVIDRYLQSREFKQLVQELKQTPPEQ